MNKHDPYPLQEMTRHTRRGPILGPSAPAAGTGSCHSPGASNDRTSPPGSRGWDPRGRDVAGPVSPEVSALSLQTAVLPPSPHMVPPLCTRSPGVFVCVCPNFSSYKDTRQTGPRPTDSLVLTQAPPYRPCLQHGRIPGSWASGLRRTNLAGTCSAHDISRWWAE